MVVINVLTLNRRDALRERYRYAVYERKLTYEGSTSYSRSFIVIKNQYGVIIHFTNLHRYMASHGDAVYRPLASDVREKLFYVCDMLNYVFIDRYDSTNATHVFQVTRDMLLEFFRDYALEKLPNGSYRSRQSIEKCISAVTMFFRRLCREYDGYTSITADQLFIEKSLQGRGRKPQRKLVPNFQVRGIPKTERIFRDMPTKVFALLLNQAFKHTPEIAFTICAQAFAGLRPGEALNLRQENSPLGTGIVITMVNNTTKRIELDLTQEYVLRSDGVMCGKIKKERRQKVYPSFLPAFMAAYERHKNYLSCKHFESAYCPMFLNAQGLAMTYANYRYLFRHLIQKYLRPVLLNHEDAECRLYGQLLYENSLGSHCLRHWFTVSLVLMGEDVAQVQYWRGDSSPESALAYLQNKGELIRELAAANEGFAELLVKGVTETDG